MKYPSDSNMVWLREAAMDLPGDFVPEQLSTNQADAICDAFGLFGTPQDCLGRLKRAESESGVNHVFIFPAHSQDGGSEMPAKEVAAFRDVILPGLNR